jgi:hypothetical protein
MTVPFSEMVGSDITLFNQVSLIDSLLPLPGFFGAHGRKRGSVA